MYKEKIGNLPDSKLFSAFDLEPGYWQMGEQKCGSMGNQPETLLCTHYNGYQLCNTNIVLL